MSRHPEFDAEQAYLDNAYDRVEALKAAARSAMDDVMDIGKGGTFQARTERDMIVRSAMARLESLELGNQPLCFGRIDEVEGDKFYIGRMGVSGAEQEPLVVDWRAPVAEPFYRATGRFPMGLSRRRHFALQGRKLTGIEDEPLLLGDDAEEITVSGEGALLAALERNRSGRMQDIVATIQGEQDEVIRSPLAGVLIVQGGPGTGKTAVALHRAAYLLYTHRFPLEHQGVLVVGPNPVFLRYIGQVLPSLGETGVTLSTISGLVHDVDIRAVDTQEAAAVKGDARMVKVIARAVRNRQRPLREDVDINFGSYRLRFTVRDSVDLVETLRRRGGSHNPRRRRMEKMLYERLYDQYVNAVERIRGIDPSAGTSDQESFASALKEIPIVHEALDRMWPRLYPVELVHDLFGARALISLATKGILSDTEAATLYRKRAQSLEEIPWTSGDAALVDEARVLLGPVKPLVDDEQLIHAFGHVVVDEAQDLSPMQLRLLARRSIGGSVTMVGDIAQATGAWAPSSWNAVTKHLPKEWHSRQVELTIGYRTPAEAMALAAPVLKETGLPLTPPRPVRSSDEPPIFARVAADQIPKAVTALVQSELLEIGGGTIGIVSPQSLLDPVGNAMEAAGLAFGTATKQALNSNITLLSADVAKGLEFDSVIVLEPTALVSEATNGLRALYVALTRTTRRLSLVHSADLPPYLVEGEQQLTLI